MDEEIRKRFDALDQTSNKLVGVVGQIVDRMDRQDALLEVIVDRLGRQDQQLSGIVARLEEQDASHDRLMGKVDRLSVRVDQLSTLASAGEHAMTSLDALSRRVAKIEAALRSDGKDT